MGKEDLESLADLISKPQTRRDWIKIILMVVTSSCGFWFVGADMESWKEWRKDITNTVEKQGESIQSLSKESIRNKILRNYIDTVTIKTYKDND